jgi:hypothetical protein
MGLFFFDFLELFGALLFFRESELMGLELGSETGDSGFKNGQLVVVFQEGIDFFNEARLGSENIVEFVEVIGHPFIVLTIYGFLFAGSGSI